MKIKLLSIVLFLSLASISTADDVPKVEWGERLQENISMLFCKPSGYFRQCFEISEAQCISKAESAAINCLEEQDRRIPSFLDEANSKKWGKEVGTCSGIVFERSLLDKKKTDDACYSATKWIK